MILNVTIVLLLVFANGFFVASEFALVKIRDRELRPFADQGNQSAQLARRILANLDIYLSACQVGITLASLGLGWVGEPMVARTLEPLFVAMNISVETVHYVAFPIAFGLITFLHITLGEQMPKIYAITKHEATTLFCVYPLHYFTNIFKPFIWFLNAASNFMLSLIGFDPNQLHQNEVSEKDIRLLLIESQEGGHVSAREQKIIENTLDLEIKLARRYMVPRSKIIYVDTNDSPEKNRQIITTSGHTRIPLCNNELENFIGIIHVKDVCRQLALGDKALDLSSIARTVKVLQETSTFEELLKCFQETKQHMVLLADEFGTISGLITLENVIEELVGSIQDEFDDEPALIKKNQDGSLEVMGYCPIEKLARQLKVRFNDVRSDTIGGYVTNRTGGIPEPGKIIQIDDLKFTVLESSNRAVEKLRVEKSKGE
jgi:CBS domain containing-hemolysin-like protein